MLKRIIIIFFGLVLCSCSTSSKQNQGSKTTSAGPKVECSFDTDCIGGSCQFGRCTQAPNMTPREIIPSNGGPPVIGIPTGGGMYIPATGGPPIMGTPTGP